MDAEDKRKLENILHITEETNLYVKKIRSTQKTAQIFKIIYLVLIVGLMFGSFYFVEPYLGSLLSVYSGNLSGLKGAVDINSLIK